MEQPQGVYQQPQQQQQQQQAYVQEGMPVNQLVYANPPQQQQVIYTNPPPTQQVIYQQQPQVVYVPQPQPQQTQSHQPTTVVVNNVNQGDNTVNHASHALLCCCTGGLWLPFWVMGCLNLGCQKPCG